MKISGRACLLGAGIALLPSCGARSSPGLFDDQRADTGVGASGGVVLGGSNVPNGGGGGASGHGAGVAAGGVPNAGGPVTAGANGASGGVVGTGGGFPTEPTAPWEIVTYMPSPGGADYSYQSVWSDSDTRAWITSNTSPGTDAGSLLRWDNGTLFVEREACSTVVFTVRGLAASDLWSAGCNHGLLHRSSAGWSSVSAPPSYWVWENSPKDLWACCDKATTEAGVVPVASNWDGSSWHGVSLPSTTYQGGALWSGAARDLWIADEDILHWDGAAWAAFNDSSKRNWRRIWGDGATVWAAGNGGRIARIRDGDFQTFPTEALLPEGMELEGVWGRSADDVWFVGGGGAIVHWNGAKLVRDSAGIRPNFSDVWGVGNTLWIVGQEHTLLRRKLD